MFSHLKYLAAASLIIMIVGALLISSYSNNYREKELLNTAKFRTQATVGSFNTALWDQYVSYIFRNPTSPQMGNFQQAAQRFFKPHSYTKVTIFSADATIGYYNPTNEVVVIDGSRVTLYNIDQVKAGTPVSRIIKNAQLAILAPDGSIKETISAKRTMVQSILPILRTNSTSPDALIEIYEEVKIGTNSLTRRMQWFMIAVISTFATLAAVLMITANRAGNIITKQHEVNLELIAATAQAEAQSRDKSQFLASVSHELRTPLNAIIGFSEIIRNEAKEKLDKLYQEYIDDIHNSGKHLLSLINDILDFSKAEAGKLQLEWGEADVTKIIHNSLRMVMPRAETAQVTLVEDLPSHHLVIVTDAKKLKQVLLNLLSNAVKFTRAGGEVRVHAWTDIVTGYLNIQVKDTGIGIAPKDISRVMTPFGQVDSALSRKYEGTGLGLPLSKKFVESMGGQFAIESEFNVGSTITISVPKAPPGWGAPTVNDMPTKEQKNVT